MNSSKEVTRYNQDLTPAQVVYEMPAARPMIRSGVDTLFRNWRPIAILWSLFTLVFLTYLLLAPRQFVADTTLLVKNNRADVIVTADGSSGGLRTTDVSDAQISTEVQMLSSRELAAKVVDQMGMGNSDAAARSRAITKLQKDLRVAPLLKSNMIQVRYSNKDATTSTRVLDLLTKAYLDRHLELHSNSGSLDFFAGQSSQAEQAWKEAQAKLLAFQQRSGAVSAAAQKDLYLQKMIELEVALHQTEAEYRDTLQRVTTLEPRVAAMPERIATQSRQVPNQYSVERLNTLMTELRNRRTELLTKFPATDRMVTQIDQQMADTDSALQRAERRISTEEASDVNLLRQGLEGDVTRAQSTAAGLGARLEAMRKQRAQYHADLSRMESLIPAEQELTRAAKIAEDNYLLYSKKSEESRIGEQMDTQKMANVIVAEQPRTPVLAEPKASAASLAAYMIGSIFCFVLALGFKKMRRIVNTPWEVEGSLALPVLGTVPDGPTLSMGKVSGFGKASR